MVKQTQIVRRRLNKVSTTCKPVTFLIMDYLTKELNSEAASAFEEHLSNCPDCAALLSTYKKSIRATQSLPCENIPTDMENRVRKSLREQINERSNIH
jgi:anti-sigma factor RsiW